jgi:serine/threonine-protein kinase
MSDHLDRLRAALADRYCIERELGRGGMATVYLAEDLKLERQVAVKVLQPELAAALGTERFLREIKLTARLEHPHILTVHDSGEADGLLYYVMPYVEGESLRERLNREKQLPIEDAIQITREVADALDFAHRHDVVHRDVKPENILVAAGHARVADFGIARAVSTAGGDRLTETGLAVGTPEYMSPEQAAGESDLDRRSDVYALGSVLYEMLTGEPPFTGPTAQSVLAKRLTQTPVDVSSVREAVPSAVSRAIAKALAKTPADRFATCEQFAEALEAIPHGTAVGEAERPEKSVAVLPFANMSADPENQYFCDGIAEEIINALAQLPELRVAGRTSAFSLRDKMEDLRVIGEKLNVATVLEGSVRRAGPRLRITAQLVDVTDGYQLWSERFDRELHDVFAIQDEIAQAIAGRLQVTLVGEAGRQLIRPQTANLRAYERYLKGRSLLYQRGLAMRQALECFKEALELDPDYPLAHAGLADTYSILGYYGFLRPQEAWPRAGEAAKRAVTLGPNLAEAHNAMAVIALARDWDWPLAEREFRRALELNPGYIQARCWYAQLYLQVIRGRHDVAIEEARRAVELDPLSNYTHSMLAGVLANAGHHTEAIAEARRGTELDASSYHGQWVLGVSYQSASRFPEAEAAFDLALAVSGRHPWALACLGSMYGDWGKSAEARAVHQELLARSQHQYVQPTLLAMLAAAVGNSDDAMTLAHRACDEHDAFLAFSALCTPWSARLRAHPRFGEIQQRMGLA